VIKYSCHHCLGDLTFIDNARSKYCKKPECQRALAQAVIEQKKRELKKHHEDLLALYETHFNNLSELKTQGYIPVKLLDSIEKNKPVTALVPDNNNRITMLTKERKEEFLSHLKALFNDIKIGDKNTRRVYANELEMPLSSVESTLLGNACATCRGYCCTWGGNHHAFQDYPSLEHYLSTQVADITEDELVEIYRNYFPTQSYQNACVFQGGQGCTLPSELRSFTCNNYRCSSLNVYRQDLSKSQSKLTYAGAAAQKKITRTNIFDTEDFVPLI
jgi:hypothetical protein